MHKSFIYNFNMCTRHATYTYTTYINFNRCQDQKILATRVAYNPKLNAGNCLIYYLKSSKLLKKLNTLLYQLTQILQ